MGSTAPAPHNSPVPDAGNLSRRRLLLLAASAFASSATMHYLTPMLGKMGEEFDAGAAAVGWVATLTFAGFVLGAFLLVPLGDRVDKRRLVLCMFSVLTVALMAQAAAPTLALLAAAGFLTGACAAANQLVVPFVAELARPADRGRAVGTVLSALFLGILFARVGAGLVATHLGWRWMYVIGALIWIALMPALYLHLPASAPKTSIGYGALIWSLVELLKKHAPLRRIATIQFLLGINYGAFWATIAAMLYLLHQLGPTEAGLMGIPGAAGILVARPAGRWMDRSGVKPVVRAGIGTVLAAFAVLALSQWWIAAVVVGAILLDAGLRGTMVANQTLANTLVPDARSRANTLFSGSMWGGNATGAFLASTALATSGWLAVCAIAMTASALAFLVQARPLAAQRD